jgi:hypothetical protein
MIRSPTAAKPRAPANASRDGDSTVDCPGCGRAAAWGALVRVEVLEGAALETHLAVPPDGWFVDVRTCPGCGRSLARKARGRDGPNSAYVAKGE